MIPFLVLIGILFMGVVLWKYLQASKEKEMGWVCTNCGSEYGDPPYLMHSSWGCAKCCPDLYCSSEAQSFKTK